MWTGFKVGHHCLKLFEQPTIEAVLFYLSHSVERKIVGKGGGQNLQMSG